ncbi:MAG: primosomal protein N' [Pseudomonadota bacterium]
MSTEAQAPVLRLAVPAPLRRLFDYLPPPDCQPEDLAPGDCLRVPFGTRELTAVLLEISDRPQDPAQELKAALSTVDEQTRLPDTLLALCQWAAAYYQHPVGEVFAAALPKRLRDGREMPLHAWRLSLRGRGLPEGALARARSQARTLALLQTGPQSHESLRSVGISTAVLRELSSKGLIERCAGDAAVPTAELRETPPILAAEQRDAAEAIKVGNGFACHLINGITGSGKTEVYLQLIERCLAAGRQALVLIPEIGLTPQTLARFSARFTCPIAALHSGLAEGARLAAWQAAASGAAGIVIGTRSAVLTALARPGLIIVDEEHDTSYKQQDGFRYSARDVAIKRAQLEAVPAVLGSATPSVETLQNARLGRFHEHRLSRRQAGGALPTLTTIDLKGLPLESGISAELLQAIRDTTERDGRQVLLFLNRRGYAPTLQCHSCGWVAECSNCSARLTVHLRQRRLQCHHCGARQALPDTCPACGSTRLLTRGLGTEQTEGFLSSMLSCPVHRVDSDAMRGRDAMQALLDIAESEEPCVILGTQMLTKGHHFPGVQLVGVIDADALLFSADFRGEERMAQLLTQVAGRAGRERGGARVLVQTHYPESELFAAVAAGTYTLIAERLLELRRGAGLPPAGQLAMLRADAPDERDGERFLRELRAALPVLPPDCQLIGPLPAALSRRAGRYRWQLWCLAATRPGLRRALEELLRCAESMKRPRQLNWHVDVDPIDVV